MVNQTALYQTNETVPWRNNFTPMKAGLQQNLKARLSSYQWT
jgi:hypothetical protein